jgi:hypothetical protein
MSINRMAINKLDSVDSPSNKIADEMEEDKTYQSRIENVGEIINN